MSQKQQLYGIQWPEIQISDSKMQRSSTQTATHILSSALSCHGSDKANKLSQECSKLTAKQWRFNYQKYFMETSRLMASSEPALCEKMAQAGLNAAHNAFDYISADGISMKIKDAIETCKNSFSFNTGCVKGQSKQKSDLQVNYGNKIFNDETSIFELMKHLVKIGQMEESMLKNFSSMNHNIQLQDYCFVLIGATSEMGPFDYLLSRGANVIAIARKGQKKWQELIDRAKSSSGTMYFPMREMKEQSEWAQYAGADVLNEAPQIAQWLADILPGKQLFIESLIYLDGEQNVRASVGMDAIIQKVSQIRENKTGLVYIDTPSHINLVPVSCENQSKNFYKKSTWWQMLMHFFRILKRNQYEKVENQSQYLLLNGLASFQGPNYALAKQIQRWRAMIARKRDSQFVSIITGPPALTLSVMHAPTIRKVAPFMYFFKPNTMYDPKTARTILAITMVSDVLNQKSLSHPNTPLQHPMHLLAEQSWHGGGWNAPWNGDSIGVAAFILYLTQKFTPLLTLIVASFLYYFRSYFYSFLSIYN